MAFPNAGIYNGTTAPIRQGWKVKWSPTSGGESEIRSLGFDVNQALTIAGQQAALGITCELNYQNNVAELILRTSNPTYQGFGSVFNSISDKWEIGVDDEKPELFENPSYLSMFDSVNAYFNINVDQQFAQVIKQNAQSGGTTWLSFIQALKQTNLTTNLGQTYLTNPSDSTSTVSLYYIFTNYLGAPAYAPSMTGPQGLQFFAQEYFRGRTNFVHSKYTVSHTTICPDTYNSNVTDFNVEKIYSMSQFLSETTNHTLWILPMPSYMVYKVLNFPVPINMPPSYQWGALKMRSNAVIAARGRIEIKQTYLIDAIAEPTYGTI
jgi:hypothetical protein